MNRAATFVLAVSMGAVVAFATACSDDEPINNSSGSTSSSSSSSTSGSSTSSSGDPDGGGPLNFTGYVKDLIVNHSGDAVPQTAAQLNAPADSTDTALFDGAFFL